MAEPSGYSGSNAIHPVFLEFGGVELRYYGLAYALGFLGVHLWTMWKRRELGLAAREVWNLSIAVAVSTLLGGRLFDIVVYEWYLVETDPWEFFRLWHGGMASHGVLLGGVLGGVLSCLWQRRSFIRIADAIVFPVALFLALGRIGNHINGEVYGYETSVPWALEFPFAEGTRHPVALYEALKNLLLIPILLIARRAGSPKPGVLLGHFVFWYGSLRLLTDAFRDYGSEFLGIGRGQYCNLLMAAVGLGLIVWFRGRSSPTAETVGERPGSGAVRREAWLQFPQTPVFLALLLFSLTIPGGWSQEGLRRLLG